MSFNAGSKIVASEVQSIINSLYSARSNRGMANSTKPTISSPNKVSASEFNTAVTTAKGGAGCGWIYYTSDILPTVNAGSKVQSSQIKAFEQVYQDTVYLARCSSGCYGNCITGCSSSTCTQDCSGGRVDGCTNLCKAADCWNFCSTTGCSNKCYTSCKGECYTSCKGGITIASTCRNGCGKNCSSLCYGCDTTCGGSCQYGCYGSGCTGTCINGCSGYCYTSCTNACVSTCNNFCVSGCKSSCTSGCNNTNRIGSIYGV